MKKLWLAGHNVTWPWSAVHKVMKDFVEQDGFPWCQPSLRIHLPIKWVHSFLKWSDLRGRHYVCCLDTFFYVLLDTSIKLRFSSFGQWNDSWAQTLLLRSPRLLLLLRLTTFTFNKWNCIIAPCVWARNPQCYITSWDLWRIYTASLQTGFMMITYSVKHAGYDMTLLIKVTYLN